MARKLCKASAISSVIFYIILTTRLCTAFQSLKNCSSSCGQLQDIRYPLRLRGDPSYCGDSEYELICDGGQAILELDAHNFFVTDVSYVKGTGVFYVKGSIHVVAAVFATGNCSLPDKLFSYLIFFEPKYKIHGDTFLRYPWLRISSISWISFLNCSEKIVHDEYWIVPCLSRSNNTFIYATYGMQASILLPSCGFVAAVPTSTDKQPLNDVFKHLQQGFHLYWNYAREPFSIGKCLREPSRDFKEGPLLAGSLFLILQRTSPLFFSFFSWIIVPFAFGQHFHSCLSYFVYRNGYHGTVIAAMIYILWWLPNILVFVLLARAVLAPVIILIFLAHKYWKMRRPANAIEIFLQNEQALSTKRYAYTDIIAITGHFREKLGQGGFGSVFKGEFPGNRLVAVKLLNDSGHNGEDFTNEVSTIGRIHHVNVVRLVGFCSEGSKRALVYDYMPNGSLDKYIFSSDGTIHRPFSWDKLNDMALRIARGIDYLHRGCDMRILHFDIKPQNILLDHNFNPKISDFGLARLCPKTISMIKMSVARGTRGYMAPELVSRSFGVISYKSDVYSFGMLLMEMAAGRRNVNPREQNSNQRYYPSYIYSQLNKPEILEITQVFDIGETERKLYMVGLWCIQMRPTDRPSMSEVVEMLEGDVSTLQMPPKPFFSTLQPEPMRISSSCDEISTLSGR